MRTIYTICLSLMLCACSKIEPPVTIAINPWPGYEFLYLAEQEGLFQQVGANIELVQVDSLAAGQRAFMDGRVDGFASTLIEAVIASTDGAIPLDIAIIADYSNGGDVIVAPKHMQTMHDLRGKRVGCEVSSLGIFILQRALSTQGLTIDDVEVVNVEQLDGKAALDSGQIDAFVTYPPASVTLLKEDNYHTLFTTKEIPNEIIDIISISQSILKRHPGLKEQLRQAWQLALDLTNRKPNYAHQIMAEREGISSRDFAAVLSDLKVLSIEEQTTLLKDKDKLNTMIIGICQTLKSLGSLSRDCDTVVQL